MSARNEPTLEQLKKLAWTKKGQYQGDRARPAAFPDTCPRAFINKDDREITIKLTGSGLRYKDGLWNDNTDGAAIKAAQNPVLAENTVLKKRVETLIRTVAISEIQVRQLKEEIREAKQILTQLDGVS
jgi:hypothetical protein